MTYIRRTVLCLIALAVGATARQPEPSSPDDTVGEYYRGRQPLRSNKGSYEKEIDYGKVTALDLVSDQ